jgi:hypothetical protein
LEKNRRRVFRKFFESELNWNREEVVEEEEGYFELVLRKKQEQAFAMWLSLKVIKL